MTFEGAIIKEQGVTFGVIAVKSHALNSSSRDGLVREASRVFGGIPTILVARTGTRVRYYGRPDIVRFMKNVPIAAIPWRRFSLN